MLENTNEHMLWSSPNTTAKKFNEIRRFGLLLSYSQFTFGNHSKSVYVTAPGGAITIQFLANSVLTRDGGRGAYITIYT